MPSPTRWAASRSGCQPRIVLLYEAFVHDRAAAVLYPVNLLRNYARLLADTPLIANIDVDMLPSLSLSAGLRDAKLIRLLNEGCTGKRHVYIIPAFETKCGA